VPTSLPMILLYKDSLIVVHFVFTVQNNAVLLMTICNSELKIPECCLKEHSHSLFDFILGLKNFMGTFCRTVRVCMFFFSYFYFVTPEKL
jgi:hypothetical protein